MIEMIKIVNNKNRLNMTKYTIFENFNKTEDSQAW